MEQCIVCLEGVVIDHDMFEYGACTRCNAILCLSCAHRLCGDKCPQCRLAPKKINEMLYFACACSKCGIEDFGLRESDFAHMATCECGSLYHAHCEPKKCTACSGHSTIPRFIEEVD